MMTDPIADMLTRIRNASMIKKPEVVLPYSNLKMAIAGILVREGYLAKAEMIKDKKPQLALTLKYDGRESAVQHIKRISKPGHRQYVKNDELGKILNGLGLVILSTPKGVMTDAEARRAKVGGEVLCEVY
ncbi:MAG: 30S ribosomal protein S8 [Patescibacteria group bacterium]|nr:30S ribosomal protein S8 [Patescibacteria group bacterium]